jgi:hypothetical protein
MKTLNTQLASWTHLRHDTILYAKQSYTFGGDSCFFPAGYVEPRVEFWQRLARMATRTADLIAGLSYPGTYTTVTNVVPGTAIQTNQVNHLRLFAETVTRLQIMSQKELAQECFSTDDELFIRNLIQNVGWLSMGCAGGPALYDGWYPRLFYRAIHWDDFDFHGIYGAGGFDALVADVHTDVPCPDCSAPDPGSVLHQAVGRVNLLFTAIEHGSERFVCAGPVLSHYEFEVTGTPRRISDTEWKLGSQNGWGTVLVPAVLDGGSPADVSRERIEGVSAPEWTRGYLIPHP